MYLIFRRRQFCLRFILWFWKSNYQRTRLTFVDRTALVFSLARSLLQHTLKSPNPELACRNGDLGSFVNVGVSPILSWNGCVQFWELAAMRRCIRNEIAPFNPH
jgi:hypothetical protein